ncbi:hypothetical protein DSM25558_2972 [Agrobacterium sp. DSM 25558]|nr:hypothetical protein DSM25558_2972 [Agrobacterium sp. DSM 25558]
MSFFLVMHTSLVEADNEAAAAQKVVDELRSGCGVSMTVKSDEVSSRVVAVGAMPSAAVVHATTTDTTSDVVSSALSVERSSSAGEPVPVTAAHTPGRLPAVRHVIALSIVLAIAIWFLI